MTEDLNEETELFDEFELRQEAIDRGVAAASWLLDGNSSFADAHRLLRGIEDGDPAVLDTFPSPLSGEWAGESMPEILDRFVIDGDLSDLSAEVHDELVEIFEDEFNSAFMDAARDEALEFMDRHTPETLSETDYVYVRFPGGAPYEAYRTQISRVFGWAEKGVTKLGQSEDQMPTINLDVDPGCDYDCPEHQRDATYCVDEYPDFLVKCGTTSRGQFCVWMESP